MKHFRRFFLFTLAFVTLPFLVGTQSWATNFNANDEPPPFGFSVDGNAKGTKLSGVIAVNFTLLNESGDVDEALVTIRLRQGNDNNIFTFATIIDGGDLNLGDQGAIQVAIIEAIRVWVGGTFGLGGAQTIVVKSIENQADCENCPDGTGNLSQVSDIVLAVQP